MEPSPGNHAEADHPNKGNTMQVQAEVQAVETAVAAKPKAESKAAPKKTLATKGKPKAASAIGYKLTAGFGRPVSGAALHAHTQAVLELSGLAKGKSASKSMLTAVMGETAIRYNVKEGKFAIDDKGAVVLTPAGAASFKARNPDAAVVEAFKTMLSTGKVDGKIVKNQDAIQKIA